MKIQRICDKYCPRGDYDDWKPDKDQYGDFYVRHLGMLPPEAREIIKAHFLRFACPMNYILTPRKNHHEIQVKVHRNDIAESRELQQYEMEQYRVIYGDIYDDYLNRLLMAPIKQSTNPGDYHVGIEYGDNIRKAAQTIKAKTMATKKSAAGPARELSEQIRHK